MDKYSTEQNLRLAQALLEKQGEVNNLRAEIKELRAKDTFKETAERWVDILKSGGYQLATSNDGRWSLQYFPQEKEYRLRTASEWKGSFPNGNDALNYARLVHGVDWEMPSGPTFLSESMGEWGQND
jgi:hypothetical protein